MAVVGAPTAFSVIARVAPSKSLPLCVLTPLTPRSSMSESWLSLSLLTPAITTAVAMIMKKFSEVIDSSDNGSQRQKLLLSLTDSLHSNK